MTSTIKQCQQREIEKPALGLNEDDERYNRF